jgi:hypothetical protein
MDTIDETTGVADAVMDGFYPSGRLEANRVIQISSDFNRKFLGPNSC